MFHVDIGEVLSLATASLLNDTPSDEFSNGDGSDISACEGVGKSAILFSLLSDKKGFGPILERH